jgi:RHS repeat-associated protein
MLAAPESSPPHRPPPYGIYAYTGREWDPETNLYYYRARYYDPKVGRFISEDPLRFVGGVNFHAYWPMIR